MSGIFNTWKTQHFCNTCCNSCAGCVRIFFPPSLVCFIDEMMIKFGDMYGSLGFNSTVLKMAESVSDDAENQKLPVFCGMLQILRTIIGKYMWLADVKERRWRLWVATNCIETVVIHERLKRDKRIQYYTQHTNTHIDVENGRVGMEISEQNIFFFNIQ